MRCWIARPDPKHKFEFQNRLDKLCVILVSNDPKIAARISTMAMQDPEMRIVVPFTYSELLTVEGGHFVANRLRDFIYGRDLFAFNSPLRSENYFFGRNQIVQRLYDKYRSGNNAGLFGLRKIGKTSVLYALKRYLAHRDEPAFFIDCEEPSFHMRRWYEALQFMIARLVLEFSLPRTLRLNIFEGSYQEKNASVYFEEDLNSISSHLNHGRFLFIFDEIENITFDSSPSDHWAQGKDFILFWQSLRSVLQKNPDLFSFLLAGVNPRCVELGRIQGLDNPIYRMITPEYLNPFTLVQVREMVSSLGKYMGLRFDEEIFTYLTEDYGGHPFLVRQVCSYLHNNTPRQRPQTITKFHYKNLKPNIDNALSDYIFLIVNVLQEWYPDEYALLISLASGDTNTFDQAVQTNYEMVRHLEGYGLVSQHAGKYYFRIASVEKFLRRVHKAIPNTRETRWQEVTTRRNGLEILLRKLIHTVLVVKFGEKGKEKFLEIIDDKRKKKLSPLNLKEIFYSDKSEIYFDDLRKTIVKNWDLFQNMFGSDRQTFNMYMSFVNKARIDAHAKELNDQDFSALMIAFSWLENHTEQLVI